MGIRRGCVSAVLRSALCVAHERIRLRQHAVGHLDPKRQREVVRVPPALHATLLLQLVQQLCSNAMGAMMLLLLAQLDSSTLRRHPQHFCWCSWAQCCCCCARFKRPKQVRLLTTRGTDARRPWPCAAASPGTVASVPSATSSTGTRCCSLARSMARLGYHSHP